MSNQPMIPSEYASYDFKSEENALKWKEILGPSLEKILKQVHPSLTATREAIGRVEMYILRVLDTLCGYPHPHKVEDMSDRVQKRIPDPINAWAVNDANSAIEKFRQAKKGFAMMLVMPLDKLHNILVKEVFCSKIDFNTTVFLAAVLEYIAADILKLIGNYVRNIKHPEITMPDVDVALCADKVLMNMLFDDDDEHVVVHVPVANAKSLSTLSYEEVVKDLIPEENHHLRELNMILKVFKDSIQKNARDMEDIKNMESIFDLVSEMHELTLNLISSLEDTMEATKEGDAVLVGSCFEDFMEEVVIRNIRQGLEFSVYSKYSYVVLDVNIHVRWVEECVKLPLNKLDRRGLCDCIKYVLPSLLLDPFYHFIYYCDIIKILAAKSNDEEDRELLRQFHSSLTIIRTNTDLDKKLASKAHFKRGRRCGEKMDEVQRSIDGWDGKNINQICNEYITEGFLQKVSGKRLSDRYVFLLDGIMVLTKKVTPAVRRSVTVSSSSSLFEFKLKEKFFIRKIDVIDREDTEDLKNAFEIHSTHQKQQSPFTLLAKSHEDKIHWLSAFFYLLNKSMLERLLDSKLKEEEKKQPLKLPSPDQYRFAIEDCDDNIVFEDNGSGNGSSNDIPIIKGGIIIKLVERLTYHSYFDPKFTKTFLTTYRTFCKSKELLALLIERYVFPCRVFPFPDDTFNIPEPNGSNVDRESMKKFRNSFIKPISFRVLNVLRQWVDHHWYDFEADKSLLDNLVVFLNESVKGKVLKKWVETINKVLDRKQNLVNERSKQITFNSKPPVIEWHITQDAQHFDIMNLHPIEIARQVTLLEFEIFKTIKSSEMVGAVWTKKDKHLTSPNLLKMIHHTTKFTFWLEKCIVESENFEERVAVLSRVLEILIVFQELNNFNGVVEVYSALSSASVHRLEHTFEEMEKKSPKLMKAFEEAKELHEDHFRRYIERLRSINPPCIPFLGMYLTNILHLEEGNPDFLTNRPQGFINFSKRRKVAEITAEIQQYQNQPYCLSAEPKIRSFIENLKPLGDKTEKEFDDYLYGQSLVIEPRNGKPVKAERKRDYSLKSPGTKPSSSNLSASSSSSLHHHRSHLSGLNFKQHPGSSRGFSHSPHPVLVGTDDFSVNDSPTDSGQATPVSRSPHSPVSPNFNGADDSSSVFDGRSMGGSSTSSVISLNSCSSGAYSIGPFSCNQSLSSSTGTLCSTDTITHSPRASINYTPNHSPNKSPRAPMPPPSFPSSSPPPIPPREGRHKSGHPSHYSPSVPHSGDGNGFTHFNFPPIPPPLQRTGQLDASPPALPPRENHIDRPLRENHVARPPPVPPRRPDLPHRQIPQPPNPHQPPLPHHHHHHRQIGSPNSADAPTTDIYSEFYRSEAAAATAAVNGFRNSVVSGVADGDDDDREQVPELPPKKYRNSSNIS